MTTVTQNLSDASSRPSVALDATGPAVAGTRTPLRAKVMFGVGTIAEGAQARVTGGLLLLYYSQILHVPAQLVSFALGISLLIDSFFDLMVAQFSDNLRSRFGRRHPLMYASVVPWGITFICLWSPPAQLTHEQLYLWLFVFIMLFRLSTSLYMVPSGSLLPELATDYHERTTLFGYRYMMLGFGGVLAAILAYGFFLQKTPAYPQGQLNPAGYPPMGIAIGLLIMVVCFASTLGTHDRIKFLHRPPVRKVDLGLWMREIASIFNNRNYIIAIISGMISASAGGIVSGLAIYFNTYMFRLPSSNIMLIILTDIISSPASFLLAWAVSRRLGKRHAYMILLSTSLIFVHGPILLRLAGRMPENGSPLLLPILMAANLFAVTLATAGSISGASMMVDVVEENQAKTGRRSEGLVLFCDRTLLKVAQSLATIVPGILLTMLHFPAAANPATLDPSLMRQLASISIPLAVAFSVTSMLLLFLFRIDRHAHARNLELIAAQSAGVETAEDT
jgi:Na+/melibiose symporter-like transporter